MNSKITIDLKDGVTPQQADRLIKQMLNALPPESMELIENASLSCLIASVEQKPSNIPNDKGDLYG